METRPVRSGDRRRKTLPGTIAGSRSRARRRKALHPLITTPLAIALRIVVPILLLAVLAAGLLYVRLHNGPISLKMLAQPIARAIAAELPNLTVTVEDAFLTTTDEHLFEVQLRNVRLSDADGSPVAIAPSAAVVLSDKALFSGRIAPSGVVLIEPRLLLVQGRDGGLSLSVGRGPEGDRLPAQGAPAPRPSTAASTDGASPAGRAIDLSQVLRSMTQGGAGNASYIKRLGLRNATLIVDSSGTSTVSRITDAEFFIDHRRSGSGVGAAITFAMPEGTWRADIAGESSAAGGLDLRVNVRDLVPSWISGLAPVLAPLSTLRMRSSAAATIKTGPDGGLETLQMTVDLAAGVLRQPWATAGGDMLLDSGRLDIAYDGRSRAVELKPSLFKAGASWMRLTGAARAPASGQDGPVSFSIRSIDGAIAADDFKVPPAALELLTIQGRYLPEARRLEISQARLATGGAEAELTGQVEFAAQVPSVLLQLKLGTMSVESLKRIWPASAMTDARMWLGRNVPAGRLVAANVRIEEGGGTTARPLSSRSTASLEAADVRLVAIDGLPAVEAPRMLVRLDAQKLEVTVPESAIPTPAGRRVLLRQARMISSDVASPLAVGDLTFRMQAPLPAALELLEIHAKQQGKPLAVTLEGVDGRTEAQFRIGVPLGAGLAKWDVRVEGKGRITEGRAKNVVGPHDVQGATINYEITDQLIDAKGDMLISGVTARLAWQRFFAGQPDEQPPLKLSARLDAADRQQLGIDINDLVMGETSIDLTVSPRPAGEPPLVQLRADLTNAELIIESLAWRKPAGRSTFLEFEIRPQRGRTELANFKVVGDDIALDGNIVLDQANKPREFNFPSFSLQVVSRLSMQGNLRADNVWDVKVVGSTFVGRDFFRSLFSVGQISDRQPPPRKDRPGLDLRAEMDTVLGYSDLSLKNLRMQLSKRQGRMVALSAKGTVEGKGTPPAPLEVSMPQQTAGSARRLLAVSDDAGQVFRLVDFYPNMQGGKLRLDVNLDGRGPAEKTGILRVESFALLGDPVVYEVLRAPGEPNEGRTQRRVERPTLQFDRMTAPFSVGYGQFVIEDADLRGPVLGVILKGKADFRTQIVDLGGTYIPLQGVNSIVGAFPVLGQLLAGTRGEGVLGMTFAIQGPMARPQVLVNPASMALPGIFREMMQMTNPDPRVTPREDKQIRPAPVVRGKASSAPPAAGGRDARAQTPRVDADGWSSETKGAGEPRRN